MSRVVQFHEFGGPEVLQVEDVLVPPPANDEVRLAVRACGLNRAEALYRAGKYGTGVFPSRIGFEAAGTVDAIGPAVRGFARGDVVSVLPNTNQGRWGTNGEFAVIPAQFVVKHPASLSFEAAAASWMQYGTAYGGLIDIGGMSADDYVVISAASSGVGVAAIQIANMVGAHAIAVTRTSAKKAQLLDLGARHVIATDNEDLTATINAITGGRGARLVFDPIGGASIAPLMEAMAEKGLFVLYGYLDMGPSIISATTLLRKKLRIKGYTFYETSLDASRLAPAIEFISSGLHSGQLNPVISHRFPLERIADAHRQLELNQHVGKIIITL